METFISLQIKARQIKMRVENDGTEAVNDVNGMDNGSIGTEDDIPEVEAEAEELLSEWVEMRTKFDRQSIYFFLSMF